jgi:hypothetical protein
VPAIRRSSSGDLATGLGFGPARHVLAGTERPEAGGHLLEPSPETSPPTSVRSVPYTSAGRVRAACGALDPPHDSRYSLLNEMWDLEAR